MTTPLEKRNALKKRKPTFSQIDSHKRKSLSKSWRAPKGLHNKSRLSKRGYPRKPSVGFGSPLVVKYLSRAGKKLQLLYSVAEVSKLGDTVGVVSATVGNRKRKLIAEEAKSKNIALHNLNTQKFLEKIDKDLALRKQRKNKKTKAKEQDTSQKNEKGIDKQITKAIETKPTENTQTIDDEEKKKVEKAVKDKVITQRDTK